MKKVINFSLLLLLVLGASAAVKGQNTAADESGINFFHGNFAEAKAMAKKENKLIFLDAYTSWCGPCRWMAANVFPDQSVGDFYNKNFISMKVDMEKGEGPALASNFKVLAYPTLLYLDGDGKVVHRTMGAKKAPDFINEGKSALGKK